jgi:uncharacterized membrane protein
LSAVIDISCTLALAALGATVVGAGFWASAGVTALAYFTFSTILTGASPGTHAVQFLRQRVPALFAVHDRRAHA